ncbi:hypothetical protein Tco_1276518, partial [Tanacetum coccineum]
MSSSSSHATMTYTSPLPANASPTARLPDYITESEPIEDNSKEDPEMDPVNYPFDEEEEEIPSPPLLLPPTRPLHTSPTYAYAPLGYRAAMIRLRDALPSTYHPLLPSEIPSPPLPLPPPDHRDAIPEADMPPRKRTYFTAPSYRFEIRESLAAAVSRQTRSTLARGINYGFIDTLDASIRAIDERVVTSLKEDNERMTDIVSTHRHDSEDFFTRHQDVQDERALLQAQISTLRRERRYHRHTAMISESEAMYARQASS